VDFDSKYGHRNDPQGYADCVEEFDARVPELLLALEDGVGFVTGDHGCDPTTPSTDHSRETVPVLGAGLPGGPHDVGVRSTFADLGTTVADLLGVPTVELAGRSFASELGL
jgi:phosphopentomutase